ncbi:hypothetical protein ACFWOB_12440 [Streptomyces sp. NPDC058420]|uniref:hypothetical protein n=1 Tax=Streptomyces sp. NPDC058420 TaxID=3346489 RepID=UPI0036562D1C
MEDGDFEQIHVLDLREGKVVGHEAVRDDVSMLGQLGVFPPSPAVGLSMLVWRVTGKAARAAADVTAKAGCRGCGEGRLTRGGVNCRAGDGSYGLLLAEAVQGW